MTLYTLARKCTSICNSEYCPLDQNTYCPLNVVSCLDVMEGDWISALNKNDRLLKCMNEIIEKEFKDVDGLYTCNS